MTSRPLLASVAELIVILAPIDQVGWRRACCRRDGASSSGVASRNGPPDAVSTRRATAGHGLADEALPDGRVLGVDRPQPGERRRAAGRERRALPARGRLAGGLGHHEVTAGDERLLVRGRDDLARGQRREHRAAATRRHPSRRSRGRRRRAWRAPRGRPRRRPARCPAGRSSAARSSAIATAAGRRRAACEASSAALLPAASATTRNRSACASRTSTRLPPDAAGRAQQRHAEAPALSERARGHTARPRGPANRKESIRSRMPP